MTTPADTANPDNINTKSTRKPLRVHTQKTSNWEDVIDNQRSEMSWGDIFDIYRLQHLPTSVQNDLFKGSLSNSQYIPDPTTHMLECRKCNVKFCSPKYFGGTPLCYQHRSNERRM